jgi:putative ABC transport system permease protein
MSFLTGASAILTTLNVVSLTIRVLMTLILANTIAMGVRERTSEYGALRAIGFLPRHIVLFVAGESIVIGVLGGVVGLGLSFPLVEKGVGRFIEENMGGIFPYFRIAPSTSVAAVVCSGLVAAIAAALPAYRASRLSVTDSLRRVG